MSTNQKRIILQPVAMRVPQTSDMPVLEPSKIEMSKVVDDLSQYQSRIINVSGQIVTGHSNGLDCWYIVAGEVPPPPSK